jgi:transitional endoplasmic reticulum ATPase
MATAPKVAPSTISAETKAAIKSLLAEQAKPPSVWDKLDVPIEHNGRAITLPGDPEAMPIGKAIEALKRREADDNQEYNIHEIFDAYPHDAAVAFTKAIHHLYGFASFETQKHWWGKEPPQMVSVKVGLADGDVMQCPLGQLRLPSVDDPIVTMFWTDRNTGKTYFLVHGTVKKRDRHVILELTTEARRILRDQSIYRGKAIRLSVNDDGELNMGSPPTFMDVSDISASNLIFDDELQGQIDTSILVPLRHADACRKHGIPLKRGILLEGPYGTGKSLLAKLAAREAETNGWTFVLLDRVQGLRAALEFATRYAPAVVFAEDIDRTASERDEATNDLVNVIDGVHTKNVEIMTILTTNHVEKLDRVILRPGRLDAVISIRAPSPQAVQRLIRFYAGDLLDKKADLAGAGEALKGQIPASIRECVERAKLGMIGRKADKLADSDLVVAANTMKNHLALLAPKEEAKTNAQRLADSLQAVVNSGPVPDDVGKKLSAIVEVSEEILSRI